MKIKKINKDADWQETLEIMKDPRLMQQIRESQEDIKAGRLYTHEEVFGLSARKTIPKKPVDRPSKKG
ncbi:MAG: hypothetical protein Q7S13_01415 [Candidatus Omnitrophota bacterium]|nr:hypothetical protein [Candidatus Omnitrophota bacterium]